MARLKDRIPTEQVLTALVRENVSQITQLLRRSAGSIESEYLKYKRQHRWGFVLLAGSLFGLFLFAEAYENIQDIFSPFLPLKIIDFIAIVFLIILVKSFFLLGSGWTVIRQFNQKIDEHLFPEVVKILGASGKLITNHDASAGTTEADRKRSLLFRKVPSNLFNQLEVSNSLERARVVTLLDHSELITENRNTVTVDNLYSVKHDDKEIFVAELDVEHTTGSGKNRSTKQIFKGYFVILELSKTLEGKTFISGDRDRDGIGHQTFWNSVAGGQAKETTLEWNQFEDLLHVATTNPIEARYILTPDFMQDLYEWWKEKKGNIRLSFIQNRLHILFPDEKIRFHATVANISEVEVTDYMLSIAKPLLHVLHLVEDVRV